MSESGPAIVPTLNIPDLPDDIIGDLPDLSGDLTSEGNIEGPGPAGISQAEIPAAAMPPPPPPLSMAPPPPPPPAMTPAPPPPPPVSAPPPPPPPALTQGEETNEQSTPAAPPSSGDGRVGLLDAIRSAGGASGAGLKSIKVKMKNCVVSNYCF